jgi:hypothetical protein
MNNLIWVITMAMVMVAGGGVARADSISMGSFEDPVLNRNWVSLAPGQVPGWQSAARIEIQTRRLFGPAAHGDQYAELDSGRGDGNALLFQDLATIIGQTYTLRVAFSPRPGHKDNQLGVWIGIPNGPGLIDRLLASGTGGSRTVWSYHTVNFVATSEVTRIGFRDAGRDDSFGTLIDDVSLTPLIEDVSLNALAEVGSMPEPGSLILLASGLAWLVRREYGRRKSPKI